MNFLAYFSHFMLNREFLWSKNFPPAFLDVLATFQAKLFELYEFCCKLN